MVEALQGKMCQNSMPSGRGWSLEAKISGDRVVPLPIYSYHSKGNLKKTIDCTKTLLRTNFCIMKLCSRLLVLYCRNCPKDDKFRYFIPIFRKLGAA